MKKIISTLALAGIAGSSAALADTSALDGISLKAKIGYENEYVLRGKEHSADNIQTRVAGEYQLPVQGANVGIYAGAFLMSPLTEAANSSIIFTGVKTQIDKTLFDVGYNYYGYPNASKNNGPLTGGAQNPANNRPVYSDSNEIYVGATFGQWQDIVTPSIYFYYDFDLQQLTTELAVKRTFKGDDYGIAGAELILSGFYGYAQAGQANGDQRLANPLWKNGYGYFGGTADIAYNVTAAAKVGVGIRYTYNNDGTGKNNAMVAGNTESNLYYGVWAEFRY